VQYGATAPNWSGLIVRNDPSVDPNDQFDTYQATESGGAHTHTVDVGPQTGSEPVDTVPYQVVNYLIKV
jgi:hypothetical protein